MKYKLLAAVVGLLMMLPFRSTAQTFLSEWGPETNGLSARLVLVLPKRSQNVRFGVKVQVRNLTESEVRYTSMPHVQMKVLDEKGSPASMANFDGNTLVPYPAILTIPAKANVTISTLIGVGDVTTTFDSAVLAGRLVRAGKWTVVAKVARERGDDALGGWYGILTIPAFDVVLSSKDLDTGVRMLEETKAEPEQPGARAGVPAAHDP